MNKHNALRASENKSTRTETILINDKIIYVLSLTQQYIFIMLMAASFGHNGHHQAISQKLKNSGTYSAKSSVYTGSHLHLYEYIY